MNKEDLMKMISFQMQSRQRDALIRQLAAALMLSFRIGEGYDLVCHLTRSPCRSNREALILWIRENAVSTEPLTNAALPVLEEMLRHKLDSIGQEDEVGGW